MKKQQKPKQKQKKCLRGGNSTCCLLHKHKRQWKMSLLPLLWSLCLLYCIFNVFSSSNVFVSFGYFLWDCSCLTCKLNCAGFSYTYLVFGVITHADGPECIVRRLIFQLTHPLTDRRLPQLFQLHLGRRDTTKCCFRLAVQTIPVVSSAARIKCNLTVYSKG